MISRQRSEELHEFEEILGYRFKKLQHLNKAFTHKSFAYENGRQTKNNERYEFLGDAVLDLIVGDYMVQRFPLYQEGILSKIRSLVVSEAGLAKIAQGLDLGRFLLLGKGEEHSGGRGKPSILSNTLEAMTAAIYLDGGFEEAESVLLKHFVKSIDEAAFTNNYQDFKSELQERIQTKFNTVPQYKVVRDTGPDHDKTFEVQVHIKRKIYGSGIGKSKKEAEQKAARSTLEGNNFQP